LLASYNSPENSSHRRALFLCGLVAVWGDSGLGSHPARALCRDVVAGGWSCCLLTWTSGGAQLRARLDEEWLH
jgi:hypothetical protein